MGPPAAGGPPRPALIFLHYKSNVRQKELITASSEIMLNNCKITEKINKYNLRVFRSLGLAVFSSLQPRIRVEKTRDYYDICSASVNRINLSHNLTVFHTNFKACHVAVSGS